ncbi:hypothetical protein [Belnapia rosea]|uniref:Uncharacterized protein n=1 Tax=Belnapia rosea TaxID=938405 RepID=A0A1G7D441_9PROT|nr:hypothetical protein [Belnapia rosea]SDE46372.1 hypothetical protein SAMN04487779_10403 [Belnapia rosea]
MAEILLFPTKRLVDTAHSTQAQLSKIDDLAAEVGADEWLEQDASDGTSLGLVASLAAAPSPSLAVLTRKVELLVTRLASDDENDAGLCTAEAKLLRSVLQDLQTFAADVAFAALGAEQWAPTSAG